MSTTVRHIQSYSSLPANPDASELSPLAKKLRLKPEHEVAVLNPPPGYMALLAPGPRSIALALEPGQAYDAVQVFVRSVEELRSDGGSAVRAVKSDGLLWIAYPKGGKTAGATDLPATPWWTRRDVLGEISGEKGYKPVAFVKIDDTWTALRFKKA